MKGAILYVNAGKGHYIPAKALSDSFNRMGHEVFTEDLFNVIGSPFWEWFCKYDWRFLLHHPMLEGVAHSLTDNRFSYHLIKICGATKNKLRNIQQWYDECKPDFIVSTNFVGGVVLPPVFKILGINIPIFQYAADVFDTPLTGVNKDLYKMYLPSELGCKNAIRKGQPKETVTLCPFPLQYSMSSFKKITKHEARLKLGLEDKFTILFALGGEGIGNPKFLYKMVERGYNWQVVAIGGMSKTTNKAFDKFCSDYPYVNFVRPGFVNNVNEYLTASDVQIGKAGANALMESIFLKRPCLITDLLYAARATRTFFSENKVGWCERNIAKQVGIVEYCYNNIGILEQMKNKYENLPIEFSSDKFRDLIIKDVQIYYLNLEAKKASLENE